MFSWLQQKWTDLTQGRGRDLAELSKRLGLPAIRVEQRSNPTATTESADGRIPLKYRWHRIPKRSGGTRLLHSPNPVLKKVQRLLLRRVFGRLKVHPAAHGFQRGRSIVTHARLHVGQAVVVRIDIQDFFPSTSGDRLTKYFRRIGWNRGAGRMLTKLCTKTARRPNRLAARSPDQPDIEQPR